MKCVLVFICVCVLTNNAQRRISRKCALAVELLYLDVRSDELYKWVCMAEHGSGFNRSAIGRLNEDSEDHGIFQINDFYYCDPENGQQTLNGCEQPCTDFRNEDLSDDVACIQRTKNWFHGSWEFSKAFGKHCVDKTTNDYLAECIYLLA